VTSEAAPFTLTVNGVERTVSGALVTDSLLRVLRDQLDLPGAKNACEQGECGSCSVLLDGDLVCSCLELAGAAAGCDVRTVEGLDDPGGEILSDVQEAMVACGAVQCGFCTPGFVVAIHDLLDRSPEATDLEIREALAGNLCRCTGYGRILEAVHAVAVRRTGADTSRETTR
jgi:carbon-monoxide dehydrogenase small subunit